MKTDVANQQSDKTQPFFFEEVTPIQIVRDNFPIIFSPKNSLSEWEDLIDSLPSYNFSVSREKEIERLEAYLDSFAELFGVELRAVLRTRVQILNSIMISSAVLLEDRFDSARSEGNSSADKEGGTFFDGRRTAGRFSLNANGSIDFGKYRMTFSVLKRPLDTGSDEEYEQDYPGYSLSRDVLERVIAWEGNAGWITTPLLDLVSWRVHDWIHQAILYDISSQSNVFRDWSKNSFFVEHLAEGAGRINYELLANHIHFRVWGELFKKDPKLKGHVIETAQNLLENLQKFSDHLQQAGLNPADTADMVTLIAYTGLRALVDIISFEDPELTSQLAKYPEFEKVLAQIPRESKDFLKLTYSQDLLIPFRSNSNARLAVADIIKEYLDSLVEERRDHLQNWAITELTSSEQTIGQILASTPIEVRTKIAGMSSEIYSISFLRWITELQQNLSPEERELWQKLMGVTEVDKSGFWYLQVDQNDFEFDNSQVSEVTQSKSALVFQIPYDQQDGIDLTIERSQSILASQQSASAQAKPGEAIIFNCRDNSLARQILERSVINGNVDANQCIRVINAFVKNKKIEVGDIYPMDANVAVQTFELENKNCCNSDDAGRIIIKPGFYRTGQNARKAYTSGSISIDSGRQDGARRRVLRGAVVQNHISQNGIKDVFPVQDVSFNRNYFQNWQNLSNIQLKDIYLEKLEVPPELRSLFRQYLPSYLEMLTQINDQIQFGPRGKPSVFKYPAVE